MVKNTIERALHSPFGFQLLSLTFLFGFLMSFRPPYWQGIEIFEPSREIGKDIFFPISEFGFLENSVGVNTAGLKQVLIETEDGKRIVTRKRDRTIPYTIKSGDNVSKIAHRFGLKVNSLIWANDLNMKQILHPGDKIKIPPADGVYYTVQANDTIGEIAKAHDIDTKKITAYNTIKNNVIKAKQILFLPGAQKRFIAQKPTPPKRYAPTYGRTGSNTASISSLGVGFIRPTRGVLTQGFRRGHYAIDIASKMDTPIYASAGGTVKIAQNGWNYGYGNYVVIDHGNGVESLYGHNNLIKVNPGQRVESGQLIALMGNSGRVFGPTGIHLHFEIRVRGRKVNPYNYF